MNTRSPFSYGTTVSHRHFTNREDDIAELEQNLLNGINTSIISPRRWGKSSLVEKTLEGIKAKKERKVVLIDMFSVNSEKEFYEVFARECIKASSSLLEDWLHGGRDFFKNIIPKFSIGIDPVTDFNVSFDWEDAKKNYLEILHLPEIIAEKKGVQFIIAIDEFQNIVSYENDATFEKNLRAVWQKQKQVTYCLYGSKRHMMSDIFNNPSKPFYKFGEIKFLQKIKKEKWEPFIINGFTSTGKKIGVDFAQKIISDMDCHSWYVQQLSYIIWTMTQEEVTDEIYENAFKKILANNSPFFTNVCENLSEKQINLLKAVAKNEEKLASVLLLKKYNLGTSATVSKNKNILLEKDILDQENSRIFFQDPVFLKWFLKAYHLE